jgi:UTP--glucose-1-phosphate uridylyltransferase
MSGIIDGATLKRIVDSGLSQETVDHFIQRVTDSKTAGKLSSQSVSTSGLEINQVTHDAALSNRAADVLRAGEFAMVVLNGGMATRFGGVAKGTVAITEALSFLGAKLQDAKRLAQRIMAPDPWIFLMCSSSTLEPTKTHLRAHDFFGYDPSKLHLFIQCESVRFRPQGGIYRDNLGEPSFHGTGHGDLPYCIRALPAFEAFAKNGKALLLSNVDNVLATVDLDILGSFLDSSLPIQVEVVDKNAGDVGGAPLVVNGQAQLVEAFRLVEDFDHAKIPVFNTNTLWLTPQALNTTSIELPWHRVEKQVNGQPVIQFERLVGELTCFLKTRFLRVERNGTASRFIPVKTPHDLEAHRSTIIATWRARH